MARKDIIPAVSGYILNLCNALNAKKAASKTISSKYEEETIQVLSKLNDECFETVLMLEKALDDLKGVTDILENARFCQNTIVPVMNKLRSIADEMEIHTAQNYWPFPAYDKLLFGV